MQLEFKSTVKKPFLGPAKLCLLSTASRLRVYGPPDRNSIVIIQAGKDLMSLRLVAALWTWMSRLEMLMFEFELRSPNKVMHRHFNTK